MYVVIAAAAHVHNNNYIDYHTYTYAQNSYIAIW